MRDHLTFLSWFCLMLAIGAGAFFAGYEGVPQLVLANPSARWFALAVATLFVGVALWLGRQAWHVDEINSKPWKSVSKAAALAEYADASFGHLAIVLFPSIGLVGTVVGLSIGFRAGADTAGLMAGASTAFYSTGCGLVAMILMMIMVWNLETGIRRAGR